MAPECRDERPVHAHWCGFCGARALMTASQCRSARQPLCPNCGMLEWLDAPGPGPVQL